MIRWRCSRYVLGMAVALLVSRPVSAGIIPDKRLVLTVLAQAAGKAAQRAAEATAAASTAADVGADGVCFVLPAGEWGKADVWVEQVSAQAQTQGIEFRLGLEWTGEADALPATPTQLKHIGRAVVLFPSPKGEQVPAAEFERMLRLKQAGDEVGDAIRALKSRLQPHGELTLCLDAAALNAETARGRFVPAKALVRDGTLAGVCLEGAARYNFHRLRLLRDAPLAAGIFLDARALPTEQHGRAVARVTQAVLEDLTCDSLWVCGVAPATLKSFVRHTVTGLQQDEERRQALATALAAGDVVMDTGVPGEKRNNQATVHGVAQSFVPTRNGVCPMVQVYAALRGCRDALPPALQVEIRADVDGVPGTEALATSAIPAMEFGHEPTYRWGTAEFATPVALEKGRTYWIYLPPAQHPEGVYMWGIASDGATERGRAWSKTYDYARHSWVYRVYMRAGDNG